MMTEDIVIHNPQPNGAKSESLFKKPLCESCHKVRSPSKS